MTEADWRATSDVPRMLWVLARRRARLGFGRERYRTFAAACARRVGSMVGPAVRELTERTLAGAPVGESLRDAFRAEVEAIRARADGLGPVGPGRGARSEVARAYVDVAAAQAAVSTVDLRPFAAARTASERAAAAAGWAEFTTGPESDLLRLTATTLLGYAVESATERAVQAVLLRCVFGNPFRPVAFDPAWRTEAVVALARGVDEARDFAALPVLADALEDAGCADAELLAHCRGAGPHARGCHAIDHALGRW